MECNFSNHFTTLCAVELSGTKNQTSVELTMRNRKFLRMKKKKNLLECLQQKVLSERLEKFVFNSNIYEMTKSYTDKNILDDSY